VNCEHSSLSSASSSSIPIAWTLKPRDPATGELVGSFCEEARSDCHGRLQQCPGSLKPVGEEKEKVGSRRATALSEKVGDFEWPLNHLCQHISQTLNGREETMLSCKLWRESVQDLPGDKLDETSRLISSADLHTLEVNTCKELLASVFPGFNLILHQVRSLSDFSEVAWSNWKMR